MMRGNTYKLDDLLLRLAQAYGWTDKFMAFKARDAFRQLVEPEMNAAVSRIWLKDHVLYIELNRAAARTELQYRVGELKEAINRKIGQKYIQEIVLR